MGTSYRGHDVEEDGIPGRVHDTLSEDYECLLLLPYLDHDHFSDFTLDMRNGRLDVYCDYDDQADIEGRFYTIDLNEQNRSLILRADSYVLFNPAELDLDELRERIEEADETGSDQE